MCGTLEIKGLTPELDSLVTFFEGEIVGEVGSPGFRTGRFGATEFDDLKHWRRFPAFTRNRLERGLVKPELNLRASKNKPYVFLRLKEKHVVNHRVEAIHGASYAGFYYCCLDCEPSIVPLDTPSPPLHRAISPPGRQQGGPRARRPSAAAASGRPARPEPSLLAQTRPSGPRPGPPSTTLSPPPSVINLPAPLSVAAPPPALSLTRPIPDRPLAARRTSSGSISYAAAVRGEPVPAASSASAASPVPELSTSFASSSSSSSAMSMSPPPPVIEVSEPSRPGSADLPTPKVEFPEPAFSVFGAPLESPAPSLPPTIWQAVVADAGGPYSSSSIQAAAAASSYVRPASEVTASPTEDDAQWPVPGSASGGGTNITIQPSARTTPPPRPPAALRRMSTDVANVLAKAGGPWGRRGYLERSGREEGEKGDGRGDAAMVEGEEDELGGFDDRGLRTWTEATISGVSPWLSRDRIIDGAPRDTRADRQIAAFPLNCSSTSTTARRRTKSCPSATFRRTAAGAPILPSGDRPPSSSECPSSSCRICSQLER